MNIKDQIKVCRDYDEMSRMAAEVFADYIKKNPNGILGLATGFTPALLRNTKKASLIFRG